MVTRIGVIVLCVSCAGCAAAPRGPAATLAQAGGKVTSALGSEVRATSGQIGFAGAADAFAATWERCQNPAICAPVVASEANFNRRLGLQSAVLLRARALNQLGLAYGALAQEAEYDARADLSGAVRGAVGGVNSFASAIAALGPAAPGAALISQPLVDIVAFGGGLLAEERQRARLLAASKAIGTVAARLRDSLKVEAFVFGSIADYVVSTRTNAKVALLDSGVVSIADLAAPLTGELGVGTVKDADAVAAKSPAFRTAVRAFLAADARMEVERTKARYAAAIAALDALVESHEEFARHNSSVSIENVARFLEELDAALTHDAQSGGGR